MTLILVILYIFWTSSFRSHCEQGILVDLCVCSYECLSGKGTTSQLASPVAFQALLIWMYWPLVLGAKVTQTELWPWMSRMCVFILLVSDAVLAFLDCGPIGLSLSVYLPSFQHCLYFAGASVNPGLPQYFSCNAWTDCISFAPVFYKCVILPILAQWWLVLPGNTVLKCCSYCWKCELHVPIEWTMSFLKLRMCEQRNCWLWLLIWQLLVSKNSQAWAACDTSALMRKRK